MADQAFRDRVHDLAALDQPARRQIFDVLSRQEWRSREDVAEALGLARSVAAFHLERLAEARLVDVRQARTSGRTGPGAGRPAKLYRRSAEAVSVSVPERRYDLAGLVLARAVDDAMTGRRTLPDALAAAARDVGHDLASSVEPGTGVAASDAIVAALTVHGYEPRSQQGEIVLDNCPFHALAEDHRELVCRINLELLSGLLEGARAADLDARLEYEPGFCCVRLAPRR